MWALSLKQKTAILHIIRIEGKDTLPFPSSQPVYYGNSVFVKKIKYEKKYKKKYLWANSIILCLIYIKSFVTSSVLIITYVHAFLDVCFDSTSDLKTVEWNKPICSKLQCCVHSVWDFPHRIRMKPQLYIYTLLISFTPNQLQTKMKNK